MTGITFAAMRNFLCMIILFFMSAFSMAQDTAVIRMGAATASIITETFEKGINNGIYFLNLHENETSSVAAAREFLTNTSNKFVRLHQKNERNVSFQLNHINYIFDPNRIFTPDGRKNTLLKLSSFSFDAVDVLEKFADTILQTMINAKLIVAMHNNTPGPPLSVNNYAGSHHFKTFINKKMDSDDFFLTTQEKIFSFLKMKNMNVVLELPSVSLDDGSLSVYCNKMNIPYINIEAQADHKAGQLKMLAALKEVLVEYAQ